MSTSKPTDVPEWCTTGDQIEPVAGKVLVGFAPSEKPAAEILNWLIGKLGRWASFLDVFFTTDGGAAGAIDFEGTAKVEGTVVVQDEDNAEQPTVVGLDQLGNTRWMIDWNGFPAGDVNVWEEQWKTTGTTDPDFWGFSSDGSGASATYTAPRATTPFRTVKLHSGTVGGVHTSQLQPDEHIARLTANVCFVQEWIVETDSVVDGGDAGQYWQGILHAHAGADDYFIGFFADKDVAANWQARTVGSSTVDTDTGVAIAINTVYRMRVEILGDNLHAGSNFLGRWFINGALVAERTFSSPGVDNVKPYFNMNNPGSDGPYVVYVGPVRCTWNSFQAGDYYP